MKCKQPCPGFELWLSIPFLTMIIVTMSVKCNDPNVVSARIIEKYP